MVGTVRAVLKAGYMPGVITSLPAVKSLGTDIEVAAGEAGIATTGIIVIKPF